MSQLHSTPSDGIEVPVITQADLGAFHEKHFCTSSVELFTRQFMWPCKEAAQREADDEDDGLGCYADGVKRTLTDDQIAIFRHSELEALRKTSLRSSALQSPTGPEGEAHLAEPGRQTAEPSNKKKRKRGKGRQRRPGENVDLRKRTWDVVDSGHYSLDYDESTPPAPSHQSSAQRRQISYDDG